MEKTETKEELKKKLFETFEKLRELEDCEEKENKEEQKIENKSGDMKGCLCPINIEMGGFVSIDEKKKSENQRCNDGKTGFVGTGVQLMYARCIANHFFPSKKERVYDLGWSYLYDKHESHVTSEFATRFNGSFFEFYKEGEYLCLANINDDGDITVTTLEDLQTYWETYLEYKELQESLKEFGIKGEDVVAFFYACLMAKDYAIGETYDCMVPKETGQREKGKYLPYDEESIEWVEGRLGKKITVNEEGIRTSNTFLLYKFNEYIDWLLKELIRKSKGTAVRSLVVSRMVYVLGISNDPRYKDFVWSNNDNPNVKLRGDIQKVNFAKKLSKNKYYHL